MGRKEDMALLASKLMVQKENIRNIGIVAHIDHGKCISGKARLHLVNGRLVEAEKLFEESARKGKLIKKNANEVIFDVSSQDILVYSLNKKTGAIELKPLTHAWKLKGGNVFNIRLRNGFEIKTTPEHKFIVLEGMEFKEKTAQELKAGDRIVCSRITPVESTQNLKEVFLEKAVEKNFYVRLNKEMKEEFNQGLEAIGIDQALKLLKTKIKKPSFRLSIKAGRFTLYDALTLARAFNINAEQLYDGIELIYYRARGRRAKNAKPMRLPQKFENFFYLAGLFFGDGTQDKFIAGKKSLASRFIELCHELAIEPFFRNYANKTPEICAGCKTLLELLNALFGYPLKKKARNIRVNEFLSLAPSSCVAAFIKGYFDCDGTVEKGRGAISITSASQQMIKDLQLLLLRFGCLSIAQKDTLYISGQSVKRFVEKIGFGLDEKMLKAVNLAGKVTGSTVLDLIPLSKEKLQTIRREIPMAKISHHYYKYESGTYAPTLSTFGALLQAFKNLNADTQEIEKLFSNDLAFIEVQSIGESIEKTVYDFTVPETHNFVAEGFIIHNTTMTDNLIAAAGLMSQELAGKQLVMDFEDQEQERGITINAANISLVHKFNEKEFLVNIIDTPGHVDFGGDVIRAMRAVDGVVLVVDAVEGVMPQTETVLRQALKENAKPVLFINKVDRLINELQVTPEEMQKRFVKTIAHVNSLIKKNAPKGLEEAWQVNPTNGSVAFGSAYYNWAVSVPFMEKSNISFKQVYEYCQQENQKELAAKSPLHAVILEMVINHLPNPVESQKYRIPIIWAGEIESEEGKAMLDCSSAEPFSMMITDVRVDKHAGDIATGRIYSGTIKKGMKVRMIGLKKEVGIQKVGVFMGPELVEVDEVPAGNIAALVGCKEVYAGETVSTKEMKEFESFMSATEPVMTVSVEPKQTKDLPKLIQVIRQITKEDPNIKASLNPDTGEHLLSGMGELHLEVTQYRIEKHHNVAINVSPPIVVYNETVNKASPVIQGKSPNKHNKFDLSVEPIEKELLDKLIESRLEGKIRPKDKHLVEKLQEMGFSRDDAKKTWYIHNKSILVDRTRGIQALHEVKEMIIDAFKDAMNEGPLAKEKVFGLRVCLHDATLHEDAIHRGPAQVLPAITRAIYAAILSSDPVMFEPKQTLTLLVPENFMGAAAKELGARRTQISEMRQEGDQTIIIAKAPVKELIGFSQSIRSATEGRAIWTAEYAGYEMLPRELQKEVIKQIRTRKGMEPEPKPAAYFMD